MRRHWLTWVVLAIAVLAIAGISAAGLIDAGFGPWSTFGIALLLGTIVAVIGGTIVVWLFPRRTQ